MPGKVGYAFFFVQSVPVCTSFTLVFKFRKDKDRSCSVVALFVEHKIWKYWRGSRPLFTFNLGNVDSCLLVGVVLSFVPADLCMT